MTLRTKSLAIAAFCFGSVLPCVADYTVNTDLGVLPNGPTLIDGTTAGGLDSAVFHLGVTTPVGNWGREMVYRFELADRSTVRITSNTITGDPDFFLLEGLGTSIDPGSGKEAADAALDVAFLDAPVPPETYTFLTLDAGVYYLAVEHFDGFDPPAAPADASFEVTLDVEPARYEVDTDLGTIMPGTPVAIPAATTAGQPDRAQFHPGVTASSGNWGTEVVYQFTVEQPSAVTLEVTGALLGNPDWILLDSVETEVDFATGKVGAAGALGFAPLDGGLGDTETFAAIGPGTYYLAVEANNGTDTVPAPGDAGFDFSISVAEVTDPAEFTIDIGILALSGIPLNFDTLGSAINTEIAIYDASGALLAENDDSPTTGGPDSEIDLENGLLAGDYTLVIAGFDTTFAPDLGVSGGGETGAWTLNYPLGYNIPDGVVSGTTEDGFTATEVQFILFTIIDPPVPLIDDLGVIAEEGQDVALDTMGSTFDTQLLLYDPAGFFYDPGGDFFGDDQPFWDDFSFPDDPTSGLSYFGVGLPAGKWYAAVQGWANDNQIFGGNFGVFPGAGSASGDFTFTAFGELKTEMRFGFVPAGQVQWIAFEIAPPGSSGPSEISLDSITYDPGTGLLELVWSTQIDGPFDVLSSTDGVAFNPVPGQTGIAGTTASFVIDPTVPRTTLYQIAESP